MEPSGPAEKHVESHLFLDPVWSAYICVTLRCTFLFHKVLWCHKRESSAIRAYFWPIVVVRAHVHHQVSICHERMVHRL